MSDQVEWQAKLAAFGALIKAPPDTVKQILAVAQTNEKAATEAGLRHKEKKADDEMKPDDEPKGEGEEADKPFPKAEAEDDEKPEEKKTKAVADLTVDELDTHILQVLTGWGQSFESAIKADVTATKEAQATTLKAVTDKLAQLSKDVAEAHAAAKAIQSEAPRGMADLWRASMKGLDPATVGLEYDPPHAEVPPDSDPSDPYAGTGIDKAFKAVSRSLRSA